MSVDVFGTSYDQCRSMVQYSFTSTETRRLVRTDSPGRPPRLSHSSWTMSPERKPSWWQRQHSQSLVTVSHLDDQHVHVFTHTAYSPDLKNQKLVGRRLLMDTWSVNICRFRAHEFSPHRSTRRHLRCSWESWNGVAKKEIIFRGNLKVSSKSYDHPQRSYFQKWCTPRNRLFGVLVL